MNSHPLHFDCLHYYVQSEKLAYQELFDIVDELIPYCIRPANEFDIPDGVFVSGHGRNISFEELRLDNVGAVQLLSWSTPIDLAERYQLYLNEPYTLSNEYFYNCTEPWFGLLCQYSFELEKSMSINQIVEAEFGGRRGYQESSEMVVQFPCYVLLQCDRGATFMCLDWCEVCDGIIDCLDGGLDEQFCFDMKVNECAENEYRCHNGLCIPSELWEQGQSDADCLERSDELSDISYTDSCFQDPSFRCEEHSCRTDLFRFSCGDGQCVDKLKKCQNGRHALLMQSMAAKGKLSEKC